MFLFNMDKEKKNRTKISGGNRKMIKRVRRTLALTLVLALVVGLLPGFALPTRAESAGSTYVLDASADLEAMASGTKADGDTLKAGTDNYFTLIFAAKTKIDGSSKTFDDGYSATQRINFQAATNVEGMVPAIAFTTAGAATIKLWWVSGGDGRQFAIYDEQGAVLCRTEEASSKNSLYISKLKVEAAGTYYLGVPDGSNNLFKAEVSEATAAPVEPEQVTTVLDATADLQPMAAGDKADGEEEVIKNYFTVIYKAKTKIDSSEKTFDDGYSATQRLNFGGKTEPDNGMIGSVRFTTSGAATIKLWWVSGGDGREMAIMDETGAILDATDKAESVKNTLYISELKVDAAGTYYIAVPTNSNYLFKAEVTESAGQASGRTPWSQVAAPVVTGVEQKDGTLEVTVQMVLGETGADSVTVIMLDADGRECTKSKQTTEGDTKVFTFTPAASGTYSFRAFASREDAADKPAAEEKQGGFVLPLAVPVITLVHKTSGALTAIWSQTPEADSYEVYCDGVMVGTTAERSYTIPGLTAGQAYSIAVAAVRGEEKTEPSTAVVVTASEKDETGWNFVRYGDGTNDEKNGYSVHEDGTVTVWSEGNKGKIQPTSTDGLAFYYTAVPTNRNFTLRVNVHVDSWTFTNGQEGFGLLATDRLGNHGDATSFWNNQLMAAATKIEYRWDMDAEMIRPWEMTEYTKYSMKLGLGSIFKKGLTPGSLDYYTLMPEGFTSKTETLDITAATQMKEAGTYNIVGNATNEVGGTLDQMTDFVLEIQKNNTGYFVTYYDGQGKVIKTIKDYEPDALSQLDKDYVYVGFFASRNVRATFDVQEFVITDPATDAPAEEKPVNYIKPVLTITSPSVTSGETYNLVFVSNVDGTAYIRINDKNTDLKDIPVKAGQKVNVVVPLPDAEEIRVTAYLNPDPDQDLGEGNALSGLGAVSDEVTLLNGNAFTQQQELYVSPNGFFNGKGTRTSPLDIYTAVTVARPGQTIVLMEGTYKLEKDLKIQRGINGTAENPIRMVSDPEGKTRPVLDFLGVGNGFTTGGDYWYFYGFDVTNSANGQKGFQISGNHNVVDSVNAYNNGNTGIQISRYSQLDLTPDTWPSYNLILNCTSHNNADKGYEDADGFAAKLTVGEGNVFDGCVAYNNADDGWDLYAKVETGPIGSVTIRNCVAYGNGYLEDGTNAGNGNGFKMGGTSISGKHRLINSIAFNNKAKGIDSNSCPDIIVENCTSYNNGSYNVAFYTNTAKDTAFKATGLISFRDSAAVSMTADNLKPKGNQNEADYKNDTAYYWNGSASVNASGSAITADMFVSTEFKGILRNEDNSINMQHFLELTDKAPADAGARLGSGHSAEVIPGKTATCTADGLTEGSKCSICGEILTAQETIPAAGHQPETLPGKEPTATESGLTAGSKCSVCGEILKAQEVIPATAAQEPALSNTVIWVVIVVVLAGVAAVVVVVLKKKK